jgi:hypothetical protein
MSVQLLRLIKIFHDFVILPGDVIVSVNRTFASFGWFTTREFYVYEQNVSGWLHLRCGHFDQEGSINEVVNEKIDLNKLSVFT